MSTTAGIDADFSVLLVRAALTAAVMLPSAGAHAEQLGGGAPCTSPAVFCEYGELGSTEQAPMSSDASVGPLETTFAHLMDAEIERVGRWSAERDDVVSLSDETLAAAKHFLNELFQFTARTGDPWEFPDVSTDESGALVVQWGIGRQRALTIYIEEHCLSYVESWGTSIMHEMDDGEITSMGTVYSLWRRLHGRDGHGTN